MYTLCRYLSSHGFVCVDSKLCINLLKERGFWLLLANLRTIFRTSAVKLSCTVIDQIWSSLQKICSDVTNVQNILSTNVIAINVNYFFFSRPNLEINAEKKHDLYRMARSLRLQGPQVPGKIKKKFFSVTVKIRTYIHIRLLQVVKRNHTWEPK